MRIVLFVVVVGIGLLADPGKKTSEVRVAPICQCSS